MPSFSLLSCVLLRRQATLLENALTRRVQWSASRMDMAHAVAHASTVEVGEVGSEE